MAGKKEEHAKHHKNTEDIIIVSDEEMDTAGKKLKKIKEELRMCERERKEYLNGWKRAKADALNEKKRQQDFLKRQCGAVLGDCVASVLPIFDAASMAVGQSNSVDVAAGVRQIHAQCLKAFADIGAEVINPTAGEAFDPHQHQAIGSRVTEKEKEGGAVVEVARVGARVSETIIRPAMVYVGKYKKPAE